MAALAMMVCTVAHRPSILEQVRVGVGSGFLGLTGVLSAGSHAFTSEDTAAAARVGRLTLIQRAVRTFLIWLGRIIDVAQRLCSGVTRLPIHNLMHHACDRDLRPCYDARQGCGEGFVGCLRIRCHVGIGKSPCRPREVKATGHPVIRKIRRRQRIRIAALRWSRAS